MLRVRGQTGYFTRKCSHVPKKLRFERSTFGPGYSETRGLVLLRLLWIRGANGTETQNFIVGIGSSEARASIHSDGAEATRRRGSL